MAAGPLIGGAVTTFASWRWVFVGEVVLVAVILCFVRVIHDAAPEKRVAFDGFGALLSVVGLSLTVYGVLRSGTWGWVRPKPNAPDIGGVSLVFWLVLAGLLTIGALVEWEVHRERSGREPLFKPSMLASRQLTGGLVLFSFQFFIQAGIFFTIPLFLSVVLGLDALQTGLRLLPLSLALLASAILIPKIAPQRLAAPGGAARAAVHPGRHPGVGRPGWTPVPPPRWSSSPWPSSVWGSVPWPPSSGRSPCRPSPTR